MAPPATKEAPVARISTSRFKENARSAPFVRVSSPGAQTVKAIGGRIYNDTGRDLEITKVTLSAGTAPTGAALTIDVSLEGTTIFTTQSQRPKIAASEFYGESGTPQVTTWPAGEYLAVDVDVIGSTVAGSDLNVSIYAG